MREFLRFLMMRIKGDNSGLFISTDVMKFRKSFGHQNVKFERRKNIIINYIRTKIYKIKPSIFLHPQ